MHGNFFDPLRRIEFWEDDATPLSVKDSYCIHAGPNCTDDGEVLFIDETVRSAPTYYFVVAGYLDFNSNRDPVNVLRSTQIVTDTLVLLHRPDFRATNKLRHAVYAVFSPFTRGAWFVLSGVLITLLVLLYICKRRFSAHASSQEQGTLVWLLTHVSRAQPTARTALQLQFLALSSFVLVTTIFYEAAFVRRGPNPSLTNPRALAGLDMSRFAVIDGSASGKKAVTYMGMQGLYIETNGTVPWVRTSNFTQSLDAILRHEAEYTLAFAINVRNELAKMELCGKISVSQLDLPTTVGGWYYSVAIPPPVRVRIDKILQRLRDEKEVMNQLKQVPLDCGVETEKIDAYILLVALALLMTPFLFPAVYYLITTTSH